MWPLSLCCSFAYPEKLLSQHFWPPSLRTDLEASVCETQKATFSALLHKLKEGSGLEKGLSFIPKMIEEVCHQVCTPEMRPLLYTEKSQMASIICSYSNAVIGTYPLK